MRPNGVEVFFGLLNIIIPGRGAKGVSGVPGDFGDEPTFEIISYKRLNHLLSSLNQNQ